MITNSILDEHALYRGKSKFSSGFFWYNISLDSLIQTNYLGANSYHFIVKTFIRTQRLSNQNSVKTLSVIRLRMAVRAVSSKKFKICFSNPVHAFPMFSPKLKSAKKRWVTGRLALQQTTNIEAVSCSLNAYFLDYFYISTTPTHAPCHTPTHAMIHAWHSLHVIKSPIWPHPTFTHQDYMILLLHK